MNKTYQTLIKIQQICKNGMLCSKESHDKQNYEEISKLSLSLLSDISNINYDRDNFFENNHYVTPNTSVRTLIFKDNKILMVKEKDFYSLPGGWCELYESPLEAAKREVKEEAGMIIDITSLLGILNINVKGVNEYALFFKGEIKEDLHTHDDEVEKIDYFDIDHLPNLSPSFNISEFRKILDAYKNNTIVLE